ncbi:hypothetical protein THERMOT_1624 [Bathymodiolus thermophilus thioautotrophic gill symbiont]|uniref:NYN domain-containing protein n=1 Tax=Bathymodiolus thermophilus thioautotrophic gill symbiont TaxID=2360 RepID=A0A1J5TSM6_9GAMM|nr:NYN domain-containing protein [Bathymodiolus thermophilus thioautotrophic gill symbiont]OIR23891.1 hypothetical protein BGC33_08500 [Bathymodiolus thermophilus thioautotrophic gill symbiont]CAB5496944.1 hypothetical protein THERMOS_594 [Bathymodiolus thermophilus thioautotrophic gill symbiont]CAB5502474.1 hypothetical protein THERMOT_1624 [Bathymodiolus thermophilus thioautotrophic gill symbiont]
MRNVAILVDGGFYLKHYKKQTDVKQVVKRLVTHCLKHLHNQSENNDRYITESERLYRIFFYDCPPMTKKLHHPITKKPIDLKKSKTAIFRQDLHKQLKQTRNVALRLGFLDERNARWKLEDSKFKALISKKITLSDITEKDVVYHANQKSVDMKIGLDIASMAYKKQVDKIVLISGDSDFVPAAKLARREGIEFILDSMNAPIKPDLHEHIDGLNTTLPQK